MSAEIEELDTIIVGGGIGGLYALKRLLNDGVVPADKVRLIEAERLGGRIRSLRFPFSPYPADLGAMRYLRQHRLLDGLIDSYGLRSYKHSFATYGYFVRSANLAPQRYAKFLDLDEIDDRAQVVERKPGDRVPSYVRQSAYRCTPDKVLKEPHEYALWGIQQIIALITVDGQAATKQGLMEIELKLSGCKAHPEQISYVTFSAEEWRFLKLHGKIDGNELYKLGFYDALQMVLQPEEFRFMNDGIGYYSILGSWNAADALPWFLADFGQAQYYALNGGMDRLIKELRLEIETYGAGLCHEGLTLLSIDRSGCSIYPYILSFAESNQLHSKNLRIAEDADGTSDTSIDSAEPIQMKAKTVILNLPAGALDQLYTDDTFRPAAHSFTLMVNSVSKNSLQKVFLWYKTPWWLKQMPDVERPSTDFSGVKVLTDLPFRQIYLFEPNHTNASTNDRQDPKFRYSMIMAYCDERAADYWNMLNDINRFQRESSTVPSTYVSRSLSDLKDFEFDFDMKTVGVAPFLATRIMKQMSFFLPDASVTDNFPEAIAFMDWRRSPYFAGWHSWKPGIISSAFMRLMLQPFKDERIFVCGESYSSDQGWIEGSLRSSERALRLAFGLVRPKFLSLLMSDYGDLSDVEKEYAEKLQKMYKDEDEYICEGVLPLK